MWQRVVCCVWVVRWLTASLTLYDTTSTPTAGLNWTPYDSHTTQDILPQHQINTECPTRYRTRHFFNKFTTNEDITATTDTFLFISHTTNLLLFKFRCNIFIGARIIKEMPGSVASGTLCINLLLWQHVLCCVWVVRCSAETGCRCVCCAV